MPLSNPVQLYGTAPLVGCKSLFMLVSRMCFGDVSYDDCTIRHLRPCGSTDQQEDEPKGFSARFLSMSRQFAYAVGGGALSASAVL